jgi:hypothetical protein
MKRPSNSKPFVFLAVLVALVSAPAVTHATTVGDEGPPAEAGLVAAQADTLHRSSLSTPARPGSRPTNAPLTPAMNSGLTDAQAKFQAELAAQTATIDEAAVRNEANVVDRLASELGTTSRDLRAEQRQWNVAWGDLLIAHVLAGSSDGNATVTSLMELRKGGAGWPALVSDMGFSLDDVVNAVRQEALAATGMARGDGRLTALARGNAEGSTTVEKSRTGAKVIRGSGVETTPTK